MEKPCSPPPPPIIQNLVSMDYRISNAYLGAEDQDNKTGNKALGKIFFSSSLLGGFGKEKKYRRYSREYRVKVSLARDFKNGIECSLRLS
jgi:hypothetical protein